MRNALHYTVMALTALGAAVLALAMFVTFADVVLRYFFHRPITGVYEVIELAMGLLSPIAILYCFYQKAHVSVNIVYNTLRPGAQKAAALFSLGCTLLVFAVMAWQGFYHILDVVDSRLSTPTLELPMWPAAVIIFVCFLLIVPLTAGDMIRAWNDRPEASASPENGKEKHV